MMIFLSMTDINFVNSSESTDSISMNGADVTYNNGAAGPAAASGSGGFMEAVNHPGSRGAK